ncbi:unnamed protein product [Peronospora belbahrii]|uniref:START domain-containing protein n=1 Tax=Peronospora belbahrii TaxID=622444 RepID=A0AAU9L3G3_9STRA|nr:unnamed protein product [Peronospora belbahrii]
MKMSMELSRQEQEEARDLVMQLLDRTLYDCNELGLGVKHKVFNHADMNSKRWKKLQSYPDLTLYADRTPNSAWLPVMHRGDWEQPAAVVAVGRMNCSVDDMLLAFLATSVAALRLQSLLLCRRPDQNVKLVSIVKPTETTPFQYLGVVQLITTQHWPFTMFVGPRELMATCATGDVVTANGRRFGYEICLSVPFCRSANLARSQIVMTRVFWEQSDGTVGMYSKFITDIRIHLPESIKQGMLCRAVLRFFWKFIPRCIEMKKLRWCLKNKSVLIADLLSQPQVMGGPASCGGMWCLCATTCKRETKKIERASMRALRRVAMLEIVLSYILSGYGGGW